MKVFLDTNVFADMFLSRDIAKYNEDAMVLYQLAQDLDDVFTCCVSSVSIATSFYLGRKYSNSIEKIKNLLKVITPLSVNEKDVYAALSSKMEDKEDALQLSCAMSNGCNVIISRDVNHFWESTIPVLEPEQFLRYLSGA